MKACVTIVAWALTLAAGGPVLAWGSQGHQLVGATADHLLTANAAAHVKSELGFTLKVAAPWPDCARAVGRPAGHFAYKPDPKFKVWCGVFETPAGEAAMVDYVSRNWHQCVDGDPARPCNAKYHFADVALQRDSYRSGEAGTNDHDVVQAVEAAILVLQDKPAPSPFSIKSKGEALFLLAHFVGDMHQPLHVGAVYLDPKGGRVDPDATPGDHAAEKTEGGNAIMHGSGNLHAEWDEILPGLGVDPSPDLLALAQATPPTPGVVNTWPAAWADDTLAAARKAYSGLTFAAKAKFTVRGKPALAWPAVAADQHAYDTDKRALQKAQIAKAGARLASILNAIWP